ncbi:MAG TPA: hypothetical protein VFT75_18620 [Nocardioidaceae bacterium]|nr:hypothetical protein [Nocardioidaceae bacterium]
MPTKRERADTGSAKGRTLTPLQQKRVDAVLAGQNPLCGSPLVGSKTAGHKNFGKTCRQPAGAGTDHPGSGTCSRHTGRMAGPKIGAARERVAVEVVRYKKFYGERAQVDFGEALLEELQRSVGVVRWIEDKLGQWGETLDDSGQLVPPKWNSNDLEMPPLLAEHHSFRSVTIADTEYAAWLRMYQIERRHLHQVAKDGIASGIAEKMIRIYQQQADTMYQILNTALVRLGVQDTDRIVTVLPAVIREVTGAA